ncbi:hypothetical protein JCM19233_6560 [Vibrio astriarenae]|nr:hypothetical protein JCM19233_6560 [Vibrio sp. C7]
MYHDINTMLTGIILGVLFYFVRWAPTAMKCVANFDNFLNFIRGRHSSVLWFLSSARNLPKTLVICEYKPRYKAVTFSLFHWVIGAYSHFTALRLNRLAVLGKVNAFLKYSDVIMQNQDLQTFYVGCYTDSRPNSGLNLIHLDTTSGELSQGDVALATSNPSYLIEREHGIYTFNETSEKEGSKLHFLASSGVLHSLPSEGDYPCHIDINQQQNCLALAYYVSGNVNLYSSATRCSGCAYWQVSQLRLWSKPAETGVLTRSYGQVFEPSLTFNDHRLRHR